MISPAGSGLQASGSGKSTAEARSLKPEASISTSRGFGLVIHAPPGTECWMYDTYQQRIGVQGFTEYRTDRGMRPGDRWPAYKLTFRLPDGTVRVEHVDLEYGVRTEVRLL